MSKLTVEYRRVPTSFFTDDFGDDPEDDGGFDASPVPVLDVGTVLKTEVVVEDIPRAKNYQVEADAAYEQGAFLFWSLEVVGRVEVRSASDFPTRSRKPHLSFDDGGGPGGEITLTAWYLPPPGVILEITGGRPVINARAFSIDHNAFFRRTPVQEVSPSADWLGGNHHFVWTDRGDEEGKVTIHPVSKLYSKFIGTAPSLELGVVFQRWIGRFHVELSDSPKEPRKVVYDPDYVAAVGTSAFAIAAYAGAVHFTQAKPIYSFISPIDVPRPVRPSDQEIERIRGIVEAMPAREAALLGLRIRVLDEVLSRRADATG
jgi:hypothetical protein